MIRRATVALAAFCLMGCMTQEPLSQPLGYLEPLPGTSARMGDQPSELAPSSLPLVPLIVPETGGYDMPLTRVAWQVLESRAELDGFLKALVPAGVLIPPTPPAIATLDFTRYQVVAMSHWDDEAEATRIVGIEERPDERLVHTVRWVGNRQARPASVSPMALHVVAVPRSAKPIAFGRMRTVPFDDTNAMPRWRPVPNPELTSATIEEAIRLQLFDLALTAVTVEKRPVASLEHGLAGAVDRWLPDAEVWVSTAIGIPSREPGPGEPRVPIQGAPEHRVVMIHAIDTGQLMASIGR